MGSFLTLISFLARLGKILGGKFVKSNQDYQLQWETSKTDLNSCFAISATVFVLQVAAIKTQYEIFLLGRRGLEGKQK